MIFAIPVVVLLVVVVGIILAKKSKSGDDGTMVSSADRLGERSAESFEARSTASVATPAVTPAETAAPVEPTPVAEVPAA